MFVKGLPFSTQPEFQGVADMREVIYQEASTFNQARWGAADAATRYLAGDQSLFVDYFGNVPILGRTNFTYNLIRPKVSIVSGIQRDHRKSTIVQPAEDKGQQLCDQFTKILMWHDRTENVLNTISEAFEMGSLVTGMGLLHLWLDFRSDPINGDLKVTYDAYNSFFIDPFFRKRDLSDCRYIWKRNYVTKREAIALIPDKEELIMAMPSNNYARDGKFQFQPEHFNFGQRGLLAYDEIYYKTYRTQKLIVDVQTGETFEWKSDDKDLLDRFMAENPTLKLTEMDVPTTRLMIALQDVVLMDTENPLGIDQMPFVPMLGFYYPDLPYMEYRVQGLVKAMQDPQFLYNRRLNIIQDILESQPNSGYFYKENALVDPRDLKIVGQGVSIAVKDEAQLADVQKIPAPELSQGMFALLDSLNKAVNEVSGITEDLQGMNLQSKTAMQEVLRQGAGLRSLRSLFDNLDEAQIRLGELRLKVIQNNWTPGKIKAILNGEEPAPEFYSKVFAKYHCVVEEGLHTATQKQQQFVQMSHLREIGVPITDQDMLEASTMQNKGKVIENAMQAQQQLQQQQEQQAQVQMQQMQAQTELAQARAIADRGLGAERASRIQENQALAIERRAEAQKDEETALLERVKALKELESIDLVHLEKLIALAQAIKMEQQAGAKTQGVQDAGAQ